MVTQYEMHGVEDLGLLKMDFLGLRNLDVIEIALDLIERTTGTRPDIDAIPLDDPKTFELLRRADTIGVFQLEGGPCRSLLRSLAPTTFEDVSAVIALYRPGPMAQNWHTEYADRKNGRKPVRFDHPDLEEILGPTFGLMIYQEQLMRVSQKLAGYSLEEADNLRKATGQEDPRAHRQGALQVRRRLRAQRPLRGVRGGLLRHDRALRRLLVQQVAQRRLRPHHVPDRVAEGEPPGAVSRGAADERQDEPRQGRGLPRRVPSARHPGARARRERVVQRLLVRRARDPVRPVGGAQRGRGCVGPADRRARAGRSVHRLPRLLRAGRRERAQQAHDRVADQRRRVRLARSSAQGSAERVRGDRRRRAAPAPRARRGHDEPLRPRRRRDRRLAGVRRSPRDPRRRVRQGRSGCAPRRTCSGST